MEVREPSARYLHCVQSPLLLRFDLLVSAVGGVAKLRDLILSLAVQGKLVRQRREDDSVATQLQEIELANARDTPPTKRGVTTIADDFVAPFDLPPSWAWVRLGEVTAISGGVTLGRKGAIERPITLPYLRVANVQRWKVLCEDLKAITIAASELSRFQLRAGDLLITEGGDWDKVGRTAIWRGELSACLHQNHVFKARGLTQCWNPAWAQLYLNSSAARTYFAASSKQTTNLASINMTQLKACAFPLPPVAEQARIVARVDELMRLCDALEAQGRLEAEQHARLLSTLLGTLTDSTTPAELVANWQRVAEHFDLLLDRPEAVDALEQTILQLAVRGLLVPQDTGDEPASELVRRIRTRKDGLVAEGKIRSDKPQPEIEDCELAFAVPATWQWARFGDVTINRDGERVPVSAADRERRAKVYDYYGASGVIDRIDGFLFDKTLLLIGEDGANLINRSSPIAFLAHGKYWVNNHAHVIDAPIAALLPYLALFINSISLEPYVTGTAQPKMNQAKLNSIPVALPPLREQQRILDRVTELRRLCADLRQRLMASQAVQSHLADALVEQTVA